MRGFWQAMTAVASLAVLLGACGAGRAGWNAGKDLATDQLSGPDPTNPINSAVPQWSYGYESTLNGATFTLFTAVDHTNAFIGDPSVQGWNIPNGYSVPAVAVNDSNSSDTSVGGTGIGPLASDQMFVHPGDPNYTPGFGPYTVVRWTAPAAGDYSVSADWTSIHNTTDGVDVYTVVNGNSTFNALLHPRGATAATSQTLSLVAGETVDFVVGPNQVFYSDSTAFDAQITAVPEPGAVMLLAVGALCLAAYGWRRKLAAA